MSSTNPLIPANLLEYHSTERLEKLLDDLIEPHPDIIWNSFEQVLFAETRQDSFNETFYYWVNTTLTRDGNTPKRRSDSVPFKEDRSNYG